MSRKSVEFHIKSNDYFRTLAAVLNLIRQNFEKDKFKILNIKNLKKLEKDLIYLHDYYRIIKKEN